MTYFAQIIFLAIISSVKTYAADIIGVPIKAQEEIPKASYAQEDTPVPFRLMSYNIRVDHEQDAYSENNWKERAGRVIYIVHEYLSDIYTFQEPNEEQVQDLKFSLGDTYGWVHYRASERAYLNPQEFESEQHRETQAIAYRKDRFNILKAGRFWLAPNPEEEPQEFCWDASEFSRVAVYVEIFDILNQIALTIITAHFDHRGVEARHHSIDLMIKKAKAISSNGIFILTGDFNTFETADGSSEFYNSFMRYSEEISDIRERAKKTYGPIASWVGWDYNNFSEQKLSLLMPGVPPRWDHVFLSKNNLDAILTAVIDDRFSISKNKQSKEVYPSDHRPILSDIYPSRAL